MTWVDGTQLFYSNKQVGNCKLDFDTHAREGDFRKDPAENLSLGQTGTFVIQVTNFNDRDYADIPFKVLVRRSGQVSEASDAVVFISLVVSTCFISHPAWEDYQI
jgi:hypothetical protein